MTFSIKHSSLLIFLALGACSPTAQTGGSMFYGDMGTEAALAIGSTASGFDPTGASAMVMAHVSRAAMEAHFRKKQAEYEQMMRSSDEVLLRARDNLRRHNAMQRAAKSTNKTAPATRSE